MAEGHAAGPGDLEPGDQADLGMVLRRFRPDVVHIHNTFPLLSPSVLYACRDARVPVAVTIHNYKLLCASGDFFRDGDVCHDCAGGLPVPALVHRCYRGSAVATVPTVVAARAHRAAWRNLISAYIFISASQQRLLAGMELDADRSFVKPNLVLRRLYEPQSDPQPGPPSGGPRARQVAYVGRLDQAKGVPLLLQAWDRYRATAGDDALRLVIAGGGTARGRGQPLGRGTAVGPARRPPGQAGVLRPVAASRAVLLPSQWEETFGLVVVEAMARRRAGRVSARVVPRADRERGRRRAVPAGRSRRPGEAGPGRGREPGPLPGVRPERPSKLRAAVRPPAQHRTAARDLPVRDQTPGRAVDPDRSPPHHLGRLGSAMEQRAWYRRRSTIVACALSLVAGAVVGGIYLTGSDPDRSHR